MSASRDPPPDGSGIDEPSPLSGSFWQKAGRGNGSNQECVFENGCGFPNVGVIIPGAGGAGEDRIVFLHSDATAGSLGEGGARRM
ncbi:hypothetical protein ABH19_03450 [Leptospirillum sp. Group II 'CF-1']|nr:hypothetical protein ABH19_03450 [Leptospirillum sp. Group II 'CF-1']